MISIVIGDDHQVVVQGLSSVLGRSKSDIVIKGTAEDGRKLVDLVAAEKPDVAVADIGMPGMNGLDATREIRKRFPGTEVLVLSMHESTGFVEEAIRAGAKGYILKTDPLEEVLTGIRAVYEQKEYFSTSVADLAADIKRRGVDGTGRLGLTRRELDVLKLIGTGLQYKEIADRLFISLHTVHVHIKNIKIKVDIDSKAELVRYAIREGLTTL